ncbi:MAG: prolyl oligopeptidase family serine peptidase [Myxococcota bacterium]
MRSSSVALQFLANLFRPGIDRIPPRPTFLSLSEERLDCDVYTPRREIDGAVLMVHGMNVRAHRDPRLMTACQAMAASGLKVFAPRFPDIGRARIRYESVERVVDSILAVSDRVGSPVGVFAPSFSAAMSLIASADEAAENRVSAVFAMGTYCETHSVIRFLMEDEAAHDYGRLIVLRNFIHRSLDTAEPIEVALDQAIVDAALRHEDPGHERLLASLEPSQAQRLGELLFDARVRGRYVGAMLSRDDDRLLERLSVSAVASRIRVPVTLLHGSGDDVIPPEESVALCQVLERHGVDVHLNVSPLISHGDTQSFWRERQSLIEVVRTFAHFFGHVTRRHTAPPPAVLQAA